MKTRETKQREAVLNVVRCANSHPTADWVYEEVKKSIPNISKGTVYRNLKILKERGEISELSVSGTVSRYEGKQENHYHFRCEKCGGVFDLAEPVDTKLNERIAKDTGFKVYYHQLEFHGICQRCQLKL